MRKIRTNALITLVFLAGVLIFVGILAAAERSRTWRLKTGEEAEAVWDRDADIVGEKIRLKTKEKSYIVPIEKLSEADQKYVQDHRAEAAGRGSSSGFDEFEEPESVSPRTGGEQGESPSGAVSETWEGSRAGESKTLTLKGVEYTFHWCPRGSFQMGSPDDGWCGRQRQHRVTLSRGFWMLETEVTQEMWQSVMGDNPSIYEGATLPVEEVSWNDCQQFIGKLNQVSGIPSGYKLSLPSEAQWEYACRAGTKTPYNFGSKLNGDKANCDGHLPYGTKEKGKYLEKTAVVKSYEPNAWGLYDMHGNVSEWCQDWYDGDYYRESPAQNPPGPAGPGSNWSRVNRGGSWDDMAEFCRSAYRASAVPGYRSDTLGLRLALVRQ